MPRMQKYHAPTPMFCQWMNAFTEEELEQILFMSDLQGDPAQGRIGEGGGATTDETIRDTDISWVHPDQNTEWLFKRYGEIIPKVNYDHFLLDIDGFDAFQFSEYGIGQHYTWHSDTGAIWEEYIRKISCVLFLDDPDSYEGGEIEIVINGNIEEPKILKPNKGDIVFFGSHFPHRVAPVISGTRRTLVCWVMGKRNG